MRNLVEWLLIIGSAALAAGSAYRAGRLHERHAPQATLGELLRELLGR